MQETEEMSERVIDIAGFTVMNDYSRQTVFITQMRGLPERMMDEG